MSRPIDIVVLGATGVTGKRVLHYLARECGNLKIAAVGRRKAGVQQVVDECASAISIQILVADANKPADLVAVAQQTRLLLNCVGPYRYTGEAIVNACVEAGTDYLDVSGEPEFMEAAAFKFGEAAKQKGCFITSACGFDSVVADLGTLYTQAKFSPSGLPATVESFLSIRTTAPAFRFNYATWESAVQGFSSADELRKLRRQVKSSGKEPPEPAVVGPKLRPPPMGAYDKRTGTYVIPFPGSDVSVVKRTQRQIAALGQAAVQYSAAFCLPNKKALYLLSFFGWLLKTLAAYPWGRTLLLKYPGIFTYGIFSREPPSQNHLDSTFFDMLFIAKGYSSVEAAGSGAAPDKEIRMSVAGPEPGYVATPIFLVQAAFSLLEERKAVEQRLGPGGAFTAGALLGGTSYIDRLVKAGIRFSDVAR